MADATKPRMVYLGGDVLEHNNQNFETVASMDDRIFTIHGDKNLGVPNYVGSISIANGASIHSIHLPNEYPISKICASKDTLFALGSDREKNTNRFSEQEPDFIFWIDINGVEDSMPFEGSPVISPKQICCNKAGTEFSVYCHEQNAIYTFNKATKKAILETRVKMTGRPHRLKSDENGGFFTSAFGQSPNINHFKNGQNDFAVKPPKGSGGFEAVNVLDFQPLSGNRMAYSTYGGGKAMLFRYHPDGQPSTLLAEFGEEFAAICASPNEDIFAASLKKRELFHFPGIKSIK